MTVYFRLLPIVQILALAVCLQSVRAQTDILGDTQVPLPTAFGDPAGVRVVPSLGVVVDSIPIEPSPGRRNVEPRLSLSYNSMGGTGNAGLGWNVSIGHVERWGGDGTPIVGDPDRFSYALAGAGGELIRTGEIYRARLESAYREFRRLPGGQGWEMRDGQGTLHRFGGSSQSRIDGHLWLLDLVMDGSGNSINYTYEEHEGSLYPSRIWYTGYEPTGDLGVNRIEFTYEDGLKVRTSYRNGRLQRLSRQIKRISVYAGDLLTRRYELFYETSPLNSHSLLSRVELVGFDDASRITLKSLEYNARPLGWLGPPSSGTLPLDLADSDGRETGVRVLDVNGDTFADVVGNGEDVYLGDGSGSFGRSAEWSASLAAASVVFVEQGIDTGVRMLDVDADGFIDLVVATPSRLEVLLNTGSGWESSAMWSSSLQSLSGTAQAFTFDCTPRHCSDLPQPQPGCTPDHCTGSDDDPEDCVPPHCYDEPEVPDCLPDHCMEDPTTDQLVPTEEQFSIVNDMGRSKGVDFADVNGDGRLDIVWSLRRNQTFLFEEAPVFLREVFLNTGSGWQRHAGLSTGLVNISAEFVVEGQPQGYSVNDVNGDGLGDIMRAIEGQSNGQEVYLGTGSGWAFDPDFSSSLANNGIYAIDDEQTGQGLMPVDFDDDGLVDLLRANETLTEAYRNTGTGWQAAPEMAAVLDAESVAFATGEGKSTGSVLADVDGDGVTDLIVSRPGERRILLSGTLRDGLLARATEILGGVTTIDWTPSSRFDNLRSDGVQGLPLSMPVVTELVRDNGRGRVLATTFDYAGGLFADRKLRGFYSSAVVPSTGLAFVTRYNQDEALAGQPARVEAYDADGQLRMSSTSVFELLPSTGGVQQIRQVRSDESFIDPGGVRHARVIRDYDDRLHPTSVLSDPDTEFEGDETLTLMSWVRSDSAGVWSLPERITVRDLDNRVLSDSILIYDNLPLGHAAQGLPSEKWDLVEDDEWVVMRLEYDRFGNVVRLHDRTGAISEFAYDEASSTFRTSARDPEGRRLSSRYDPRFGTLVRDVDPSGNERVTEYDAFGRLARVRLPGDESSPFATQTYTYSPLGDPETQFYRIAQTETPGLPETLETTTYFDAMGLIYRAEQEGADGRVVIALVEFDENGNTTAVSNPFFETETPVFTHTQRDELGRPTRVIDPAGNVTTLSYAGKRVDFKDKLGFESSMLLNGNGDIEEIHEWVDGVEQVTSYDYDPAGRMVRIVDALGSETRLFYDGLGRRVRLEDPNAGSYQYHYDGEGRLLEQTAPDGQSSVFDYNLAGDLIRKMFPDGSVHEFTYGSSGSANATGRLVRVQDAAGDVRISYDARGNVIERRRTLLGRTYVTGFAFDSLDRIRGIAYPDGFVVTYSYGADGAVSRVTDGEGHDLVTGIQRNAEGQIEQIGYGNGVWSSFSYDKLSRMRSILTTDSRGSMLQSLAYEFDANDNVTEIMDSLLGNSQSFGYDSLNRIAWAAGPYGEEIYDYDAIGNLLRKGSLFFEMDPEHPQRVACGGAVNPSVGGPRPREIRMDDGHSTAVAQKRRPGGGPCGANGFLLTYDDRGNVVRKGDRHFEYDAENRLVTVRDERGRLVVQNVYDAAGQRIISESRTERRLFIDGLYEEGKTHVSRHVRSGSLLVATLVVPKATVDLVDEVDWGGIGGSPPHSRDPGGWLVGITFLLVAVCAVVARRFIVRVDWRGPVQALGEALVTVWLRPSKAGIVVSLVLSMLLASMQHPLVVAAQPSPSQKVYYYHSNHLGSVNVVTDDKGKVVERREYKPFGDRFDWTGPEAGPRELLNTFGGHRYDDTTGLYYMGARHYDSELGRFLSADNQVTDPSAPKSLHRYAFAANNPIRYVDPDGRSFVSWIKGIANDVGEFFSENKDIFLIIGAAALVVVLVAVTVATFGATSGLLVAGAALLGGAIFAAIAVSQGHSPTSVEFWKITLTGALLGAAIGAGLVALPAVMASSSTLAVSAAQWALVGAAMGAAQETIAHFANGGSVENLLGSLIASTIIGFVTGAVLGGIAKGAASAVRHARIVRSLEKLRGFRGWLPRLAATIRIKAGTGYIWLAQAGKVGIAVKLAYAGIASWRRPGKNKLIGDIARALVFQDPGQVAFLEEGIDAGQSGVGAAEGLLLNELSG